MLVQEQKNEYDKLAWYKKLFYYNNNNNNNNTLKSNENLYRVSNCSDIFSETFENGLYRIKRGVDFIKNLQGVDRIIINSMIFDINNNSEFDMIPILQYNDIVFRKAKNASKISCDIYIFGKGDEKLCGWCFYNNNNVKLIVSDHNLIGKLTS